MQFPLPHVGIATVSALQNKVSKTSWHLAMPLMVNDNSLPPSLCATFWKFNFVLNYLFFKGWTLPYCTIWVQKCLCSPLKEKWRTGRKSGVCLPPPNLWQQRPAIMHIALKVLHSPFPSKVPMTFLVKTTTMHNSTIMRKQSFSLYSIKVKYCLYK